MTSETVMAALSHARRVLCLHRKMQTKRGRVRAPARSREGRLLDIADVVTDLRHLAGRYGIMWDEVVTKVDSYMEADRSS